MSMLPEPRDDCVAEDMTVISEEYPVYSVLCQLASKSPALSAEVFGSPPISPLMVACASENAVSILPDACYHSRDCVKEGLVADALFREATEDCLGTEESEATSTELSPNEVFVFNIKYSATKAQLKSLFSSCGAVASVSLPFDAVSSRIRGYAFVAFERAESVKRAIEQMNGFYLKGRPLSVRRKTECKSPSTRSKTPGITKSATRSTFKFPDTDVSAVDATETLFVGNLPFDAKRGEVSKLFSEACGGRLKVVRLVKDASEKSRGFGYVDFFWKEDAARALSLNGHLFSGRFLRVNYAEGYNPDFHKKKVLQRSAPSDAITVTDTTTGLNPVFDEKSLAVRRVSPIGGDYVIQVPRGYALIPVVSTPMAALRVTAPRYFVASGMLPLADARGAFGYWPRRPLPPAPLHPCHWLPTAGEAMCPSSFARRAPHGSAAF